MAAVQYLVKFQELCTCEEVNAGLWEALIWSPKIACALTNSEFFANLSFDEIRRLGPNRLLLLLQKVASRLELLIGSESAGTPRALGPQLLSCCRLICRLCPVAYEQAADLVWKIEGEESLGAQICRLLASLLHFRGFTVPLEVTALDFHAIWRSGVGCPLGSAATPTNVIVENRGIVILAVLAVLSEARFPEAPKRALDCWSCTARGPYIFCSLLNVGLQMPSTFESFLSKINTPGVLSSQIPQDPTLPLLLLLISVTHLSAKRNEFRWLLSRLSRDEDLDFLATTLTENLQKCVISSNPRTLACANLYICLSWELVQANKKFAESPKCAPLALVLAKGVDPSIVVPNAGEEPVKRLRSRILRLSAYCLTSLTAVNAHAAASVGPQIFRILETQKVLLNRPDLHLAAVIDIFYNCSPCVRLPQHSAEEFVDIANGLKNAAVAAMFSRIHGQLKLPASFASPEPAKPWEPIQFQWDRTRLEWYEQNFWGIAMQCEPDILDIGAAKVEPQPLRTTLANTLEMLRKTAF